MALKANVKRNVELAQNKYTSSEDKKELCNLIRENDNISNKVKDFTLESNSVVKVINEDNTNYMFSRKNLRHLY